MINVEMGSNNVLIKFLEREKVTKGGLIIPDSAEAPKKSLAEVIVCGKGEYSVLTGELNETTVANGDIVSLNSSYEHSGNLFEYEGQKYYIVKEDYIDYIVERRFMNDAIIKKNKQLKKMFKEVYG